MCGITGVYGFNMIGQLSMINLANATKALASRGPDFQNTFNDHRVGLGHRRLSVIDTSPAGHQPMYAENDRYVLVFNGEIYNFNELKKPLIGLGQAFNGHSDTEVLLYHLIHFGKSGIEKLNGFFSFAFYDREEGSMILAIDRYGIKPLYYLMDDDKLIFASEMKSLLCYGIQKEIDHSALITYFQLNYIPAPKTILNGVNKLPPGGMIEISGNGNLVSIWKSEQDEDVRPFNGSFDDAAKQINTLMQESISKRLISDVPIGTFLSGGLDSSIISAIAKEQKDDLNTYSIGFDHRYFDESEYSTLVANHIQSNHHRINLGYSDFEKNLEDIMDYFDEPFADSSSIAYFLLSKETKKDLTVALSGDGADELFAGYRKHLALHQSITPDFKSNLLKSVSPLLSLLPSSRSNAVLDKFRQVKRYAKGLKQKPMDRYWEWARFIDEKAVAKMLLPSINKLFNPSDYSEYRNAFINHLNKSDVNLNDFLKADLKLVLPGDMLTKVDRMSMANGLEVRVPFLDKSVVNFAMSLPPSFKIKDGIGKHLLNEAFKDRLPEKLFHRPKQGFEVPLLQWLKKIDKRENIQALFSKSLVEEQGIFNYSAVRKLRTNLHSISPGDSHASYWSYLVFQWWYKKYFL